MNDGSSINVDDQTNARRCKADPSLCVGGEIAPGRRPVSPSTASSVPPDAAVTDLTSERPDLGTGTLQAPVPPGSRSAEDISYVRAAPSTTPSPSRFTLHQKITLVSVALAAFSTWLNFSIISVFFPVEAKAKGMSQTVIGLVFSSFSIANGLGSPLFGKILPIVGARFMFLAGAFVTGGCNLLFGFIVDMPTRATFTVFCFVIRVLEGLGTSACVTATYAIVVYTFPENVGAAVSVVEMVVGLSLAVGPALGGLLYNVGGFKLPFLVLGGTVLLILIVNVIIMPEHGSEDEETGSLLQVSKIPAIWISFTATVVGSVGLSALDATLSLHLKDLNFNIIETSLLFANLGAVYGLTSCLWGFIIDKKKNPRFLTMMGAFCSGVFFLLIGPSPMLKIPSTKTVAALAINFGAGSLALLSTPVLLDMLITAEWYGVPNNMGLHGIVSGLWNAAYALGSILGPLVGSGLSERLGFGWAATIIAGAYIADMLVICLFGVWEYRCGKGRRMPPKRLESEANSTNAERTRLISEDA